MGLLALVGAGVSQMTILFSALIGIAVAGSVLGGLLGLLGVAVLRLVMGKRPTGAQLGIGCAAGGVIGMIILFAISFFYLYSTGVIYFPQDS